jgi:hypothetical protein
MIGCVHVCNQLTFTVEQKGKTAVDITHSKEFTFEYVFLCLILQGEFGVE